MYQDLSMAGRIKDRLESLGYWHQGAPDLKRVSSESGFGPSALRKWLAGTVPSLPNSLALADFLGVRLAWLMTGEGPAEAPPRLPRPRDILTRNEMERALVQAVVEYPNECCGVVLISVAKPTSRILLPCRNVQNLLHASDPREHTRDARTAFYIDPRDLEKIGSHMDRGYEVGTIYHSHVETTAHFSASDKAQALVSGRPAYPEAFYLVMSVMKFRIDDVQAYAWESEQKDFLRVWPNSPTDIGDAPARPER